MFGIQQAVIIASGLAVAQVAAAQDSKTTTISRDNPAAKSLVEPAAKTKEDFDRAKPLDWNKTIGTPKRVEPTAEEQRAAAEAKPGQAEGGPPEHDDEAARDATQNTTRDEPPARDR